MTKAKNNCYSVILSMSFIVSSLSKSVNLNAFENEIGKYVELYMPYFCFVHFKLCAALICVVELLLGFLGLDKHYGKITSVSFCVMMTFFLYLTGVNVFSPSEYYGSVESCGCFGELIHFTPITSFMKSLLLWGIAIVNFIATICIGNEIKERRTMYELKYAIKDWSMYFVLLLSCIPTLFSFSLMSKFDKNIYECLYVIVCLIIVFMFYIVYMRKR